ncbi:MULTISPECIES: hypothetical protein [unclassified Synechocystis]|uniref:hypothetical protein n=1 Tax=unclassified Synechocystis TaxID=2640012 RepID=UPI000406DD68|nr:MULTISPECIES: hypothetical protein [unclassified Synechocystis]AIE75336.1 hypothetical protein D082_28080 [Synechocystis sp. PCC 6714]MCT0253572.1 hypothetical protein [Synechocystis sp. CS-94]
MENNKNIAESEPAYVGTILYPDPSPYALAISPLVQLKKIFQALYTSLLKMMWRELLAEEVQKKEAYNLILFLIFLFLSWLTFTFRTASQWLFIVFFIFWFIDNAISYKNFQGGHYIQRVYLRKNKTGDLSWQLQLPNKAPLFMEFNPGQVQAISVRRREIRGGAFEDKLATVWQGQLLLYDGSDWIFEEDQDLDRVLEAIAKIQKILGEAVPVGFEHSHGLGAYALNPIPAQEEEWLLQKRGAVGLKRTGRKWHIFSRWRWEDSWSLIRQIFRESGFLLFFMLMVGFMVQLGGILDGFRRAFAGEIVYVEVPDNFGLVMPWQDWRIGLPLLLAIAIMIYRGRRLSRVKHCSVDHHFVRANLDNHSLGKLPTDEVEAVLAVGQGKPEVLLLSANKSLLIPSFQRLEEALIYACVLTRAIDEFSPVKNPTEILATEESTRHPTEFVDEL